MAKKKRNQPVCPVCSGVQTLRSRGTTVWCYNCQQDKIRSEKEPEAQKMWAAQCDVHQDGPAFEYEWINESCFITGTVWDGRRVTVQVIWDRGPGDCSPYGQAYVRSGLALYRFVDLELRTQGSLVLVG